MVHVWQFNRGVPVKRQSIIARAIGGGYAFKRGKPWYTYNVEQQAEIIEAWNWERKEYSGTNDELFPYVHYIIRGENAWQLSQGEYNVKTLEELWRLLNLERLPVDDTTRVPTQVTVGDDYMVAVLSGDVLLDFDKAVVKPAADPVLQQAAATIRARTTPRLRKILINGHADSVGGAGYNEKLSERRAEAVAKWFTSRNLLPAHLLLAQGFGESHPRFPNTSRENMAKNRRVEIIMVND
jgi:outer membrane protein OmpA-like peptidoglycan-associated protein